MARPSVIPGIKARLEEWLDQREAAYLAQPEATRQPTLIATKYHRVRLRPKKRLPCVSSRYGCMLVIVRELT